MVVYYTKKSDQTTESRRIERLKYMSEMKLWWTKRMWEDETLGNWDCRIYMEYFHLQLSYSSLLFMAIHCNSFSGLSFLSLPSHFLHSFIGFSPLFFHSFSLVLSISSSLQPSRSCPLLLFPLSLSPFSHGCESLWVTWSRWVVGHNLVVDRIWW